MHRRVRAGLAAVAGVVALAGCSSGSAAPSGTLSNDSSSSPVGASSTATTDPSSAAPITLKSVAAENLDVPWGLAFLPDGAALVTLRDTAHVLAVRAGSKPTDLGKVPGVDPSGEGGLLGIAVSPSFTSDHRIFVYYTASSDNRIARMTLHGDTLRIDKVILDGIPKGPIHNGGRLEFGPDRYLYAGTGETGDHPIAQSTKTLGGKILRITQNGAPAPGDPFDGSPIWTYGHRNVQGLAWDAAGRMYASEFGQDTWDELNLIRKGGNYGWPVVEGKTAHAGMVEPLLEWRTDDASPSGLAYGPDGALYMAALAGRSLWRIPLQANGSVGSPQRLLDGRYGRLRTVEVAPDHTLWVITSNTFRGAPGPSDDRILVFDVGGS